MLFNSIAFLIFFPLVVGLFFSIPRRFQWMLLLAASSYFYMAFVPKYILILLFLIVVDFFLGLAIERQEGVRRKVLLIVSICTNLGTLFLFKYFNFFNENITLLADAIGWNYSIEALKIILPLGLSFHVFQSLSYVIEVYRRAHQAERHIGIYALYVMFFPQLVAGPIERPQHLLPQLHEEKVFLYERALDGLTIMLWGFFKKLVIADQLAVVVDHVFGNLYTSNPTVILIAVILFAYQLYCDFSGYSDIAVGSARVLGYELMQNFERPYRARSIAEFWRRWHISLSNWLRDYLYYPLAISWRSWGKAGSHIALFITFVLIGLWHGANWTFIILGAIHGAYLVLGQLTKNLRTRMAERIGVSRWPRLHEAWQVLAVFSLVAFSWIFFRAPSFHDAWYIVSVLPEGVAAVFDLEYLRYQVLTVAALGIPKLFLLLRVLAIAFMEIVERYTTSTAAIRSKMILWPLGWRLAAYYVVVFWILLLGNFGAQSFIYFQF